MNPNAMNYLNEALNYIQENALARDRIDWPLLREEICISVGAAKTIDDTYPGIELALKRLEDHHSVFYPPSKEKLRQSGKAKRIGLKITHPDGVVAAIDPGSPAASAGLLVGDHISALNGTAIAEMSLKQVQDALTATELDITVEGQESNQEIHLQSASYNAIYPPTGRIARYGYLALPGYSGNATTDLMYAETLQTLIKQMDQEHVQGWIIDLRRNGGGNMYPMIAGLGPILGEGCCVAMVAPGEEDKISYRDGQALIEGYGAIVTLPSPYTLNFPGQPAAILLSQLTASSGEFVALSFVGRPHTRSFGEATYGVPTGNLREELSDGAAIYLTTKLGSDRLGNVYSDQLHPDEFCKTNWLLFGADDDPVLKMAQQWLASEIDFYQ